MKIAIFAYSQQGCAMVSRVRSCFPEASWNAYTVERLVKPGFFPISKPTESFYGSFFQWANVLIFVGSCGIAVRAVAAHIRNKCVDPAVVCVDDQGTFVISLLSGHIGGANEITKKLAMHLQAIPVVTTATDIHERFSVDCWATQQGFVLDSMQQAKTISASILEGTVSLLSEFPVVTDYPEGVIPGDCGVVGIYISWQKKEPFAQTLRVIPPILHLGIGCRKGVSASAIHQAVTTVLEQSAIDSRAICCVASIDLKREEAGLVQYCQEHGWSLFCYSAEVLQGVSGEFTSSAFVQQITGVDSVCERAALVGSNRLIVKKTVINGITVAIAAEHLEVRFE